MKRTGGWFATVLVALLLKQQTAFAVDYYWSNGGYRAESPAAVCDLILEGQETRFPNADLVNTVTIITEINAKCSVDYARGGPHSNVTNLTLRRYGSGCTDPSVYDPSVGSCIAPDPSVCEHSIGQDVKYEHRLGAFTGQGKVGGRIEPPPSVCKSGCQYASNQGPPSRLYRFKSGDPAGVFGEYTYKGNGLECKQGENPDPEASDYDKPQPTIDSTSECAAKYTDANGGQHTDCVARELAIEPGDIECVESGGAVGTVGGELTCIAKDPGPKLTDTKTETKTTETENSDGSSTSSTETTTTKTECSGVNACSTTTTTNNNSSSTNSDGSSGGESESCSGPGCKTEGNTEEPAEEEEEPREAAVGGCDADIACSGDPIDCANLKKQKEQLCFAEEQADFPEQQEAIAGLFQGEKFEVEEGTGDIEVPSFVSQGTRFLPASCPAAETLSLKMGGGKTFALSYEPLCRAATDLSGLFVAVATIFAALYVGRSVGGK
ncbi:conserved exported protein of unknown function [Pseudomonas marincola]|uniref:TspB protein n=1 Tax=Pseudomonas marincola TaxID=437900 RepID=A0A653E362_9PSED|nr:virulence factor TspB C-terminal domain-related protein [Pseudomonas marincola]CAE6888940.1 conserved exported protein of unknown function [Pseudomonas marincola]